MDPDRLCRFMGKQVRRLGALENDALQPGAVEAVHRSRVACRRLIEPLRLVQQWGSRTAARAAARRFDRWRRALRDLRDLDVLMDAVRVAPADAGLSAASRACLLERLCHCRDGALAKARRRMARVKTADVLVTTAALAAGFMTEAEPATTRLDRQVRKHWLRRVRRWLATAAPGVGLHDARVALKRVRYSTELAARMLDSDPDALLERCAAVQDALGMWNDHIGAAERLATLAGSPSLLATDALTSAEILRYAAWRAAAGARSRDTACAARTALDHALQHESIRLQDPEWLSGAMQQEDVA